MWDLGNRGIIVLVSVVSGCVIAYNVAAPVIALALALTLTLVSLLAFYCLLLDDDSFSSLHPAFHQLARFLQATLAHLNAFLGNTLLLCFSRISRDLRNFVQRFQAKRPSLVMHKPRLANAYQLSVDSSLPTSSSSRFDAPNQLSPIPHMQNKLHRNLDNQTPHNQHSGSFSKYTSTPVTSSRRDDSRNGDLTWNGYSSWKKSPLIHNHNHSESLGENLVCSSGDETQWGVGSNPKMRSKAGGIKTVQTTAGPLLASTRYNIDPKVYSDVTSPGLTTRLSKYAMEANEKLTHQPRYGPGQFPKVNLNVSPVPLLNTKYSKTKTPVMVRIAPPENTRYSPPERQKVLSNLCLQENKGRQNVARVFREMSLKRHASGEEITAELAKKQRTDGMFGENVIRTLEETKQKRSRDESSKSEEDSSPETKGVRPTKRTKTPSCYDILNSLSSSVHVISGVKRKAVHLSRSGTPDFGKHFKLLDNPLSGNSQASLVESSSENVRQSKRDSSDRHLKSMELVSQSLSKAQEQSFRQGTSKSPNGEIVASKNVPRESRAHPEERSPTRKAVQLRDKLFMRAEPQKTDKLKLLVEEHNVKAQFTTNDCEEIKKEDIVNMRQTSMRARLQSMFDAIAGKTESKINPDVVIQAEEVNVPTPTSSACATLNSSTTTTNVNTSPIATSAIASIDSMAKSSAKSVKHVTFNLPNGNSTQTNDSQAPSAQSTTGMQFGSGSPGVLSNDKSQTTSVSVFGAPSSNGAASSVNFGNTAGSPSVTSSSALSPNVSSNSVTSVNANEGKSKVVSPVALKASNSTASASPSPSFVFQNSPLTRGSSFGKTTESSNKGSVVPSANTLAAQATGTSQSTVTAASSLTSTSSNLINPTPSTTSAASTLSFAFGAKSTTPQNTSFGGVQSPAPTITFGTSQTTAQTSSFATPQTTTQALSFGTTQTTAKASGFSIPQTTAQTSSFTTPQTTTQALGFGTTQTMSQASSFATAQTTTQAPTFGTTQTTKVGGFSLGTNSSQTASVFGSAVTAQNVTPTTSGSAFPKDTATTSTSTTSSSFPSLKSVASTGVFTFGANSAVSGAKPFSFSAATTSSSSTTPVFGATASASGSLSFSAPSTTSAPQFGTTSTTSAPVFASSTTSTTSTSFPGPPSLFSATSAFSAPKTTASPSFGSSLTTSAFAAPATTITTTASGLFSSLANNPTTSESKPSAFVATSSAVFGQTPSSFGAGGQAFGSTVPSFFASQTTTTTIATTTTASTTTSSFAGAQSLPAFGSANNSTPAQPTPAFGSSLNTTPAFGNAANASSAPMFGASATSSSFAAPSTTASTTFGSQTLPTTTANTFAANAPTLFGATSPNASATSIFGTSTSAPAFGGTNSTTFSFGGSQPPAQPQPQSQPQQPQQTTAFSFGSNAASSANANTPSAPFQFGATTSKSATTGFNFSAPSATPNINFGSSGSGPAFNAPSTGMFSIGSGSSAPRSRSTRPRKPR